MNLATVNPSFNDNADLGDAQTIRHISGSCDDYPTTTIKWASRSRSRYDVQGAASPVTQDRVRGMSVLMTAVFMVIEIAGAGTLYLSSVIENTGWVGLILLVFSGVISSYTGAVLGECWTLVETRFPKNDFSRYPYPGIGTTTFGAPARIVISVAIDCSLFGGSCVFLLLASQNLHSIFKDVFDLPVCYWAIVVTAFLTPFCMRATPKEFEFVPIGAIVATSVACVIMLVLMGLDSEKRDGPVIHRKVEPMGFAAAFGAMCFAFGGHPAYPTFQQDMKQREKFGCSCYIAYSLVLLLYFPVAAGGYFVYGDDVQNNILNTVSKGPALTVIQSLITLHLSCSLIVTMNPLFQEAEEAAKINRTFNYKRVLIRMAILMLLLFVAEAVPSFGDILTLIGGSSTTILAYLAPPIFYFKLAYSKGPWEPIKVPLARKVVLIVIMVVGTLAGVFSTYSAITSMTGPSTFSMPCFLNVTTAD